MSLILRILRIPLSRLLGGTAETDIVLGTVFDFLEGAGVVSAAAAEGL